MATKDKPAEFDPREHVMTWEASKKVGGKYETVVVEYLPAKWRIVWLRSIYPKALIETTVERDAGGALVRALVTLEPDLYATGHAYITDKSFGRSVEKAETQAVGRALAFLGFGTEFAVELDADEGSTIEELSDSPQARRDRSQSSGKSNDDKQAAQAGRGAPRRSSRSGGATKSELEEVITPEGIGKLQERVREFELDEIDVVARVEEKFGKSSRITGEEWPGSLEGVLSGLTVGQGRALYGELERLAKELDKAS